MTNVNNNKHGLEAMWSKYIMNKGAPRTRTIDAIKESHKNITLTNYTVNGSISSSLGNIKLDNVEVRGDVRSSNRDIWVQHSDISGGVETKLGRLTISDSKVDKDLKANNGDVTVYACKVNGNISSLGKSRVIESEVAGDVTSGYIALCNDSKINGTLKCSNEELELENVTAENIIIENTHGLGSSNIGAGNYGQLHIRNSTLSGSSIIGGGNVFDETSQQITSGSRTLINVSEGSSMIINQFKASATSTKTRITTPGGSIYENGERMTDTNEPKTYAGYKASNPNAPEIKGPGWKDGDLKAEDPHSSYSSAEQQTINLVGKSMVTGNITFTSGNGKVILGPEAQIKGKVIGGVIERITE